jgi:hypothetical protein
MVRKQTPMETESKPELLRESSKPWSYLIAAVIGIALISLAFVGIFQNQAYLPGNLANPLYISPTPTLTAIPSQTPYPTFALKRTAFFLPTVPMPAQIPLVIPTYGLPPVIRIPQNNLPPIIRIPPYQPPVLRPPPIPIQP